LLDYYQKVGLPALLLGELDRQRGVMTESQIALFASTANELVENLADTALEEEEEDDDSFESDVEMPGQAADLPNGDGKSVLCIGGRGLIDDAAASMIAQVLAVQGTTVSQVGHKDLSGKALSTLALADIDTALVILLNRGSKPHARQAIRRLKRIRPSLRVGIVMPSLAGEQPPSLLAEDISADFVASNVSDAVRHALTDAQAVRIKASARRGINTRPGQQAAKILPARPTPA